MASVNVSKETECKRPAVPRAPAPLVNFEPLALHFVLPGPPALGDLGNIPAIIPAAAVTNVRNEPLETRDRVCLAAHISVASYVFPWHRRKRKIRRNKTKNRRFLSRTALKRRQCTRPLRAGETVTTVSGRELPGPRVRVAATRFRNSASLPPVL